MYGKDAEAHGGAVLVTFIDMDDFRAPIATPLHAACREVRLLGLTSADMMVRDLTDDDDTCVRFLYQQI